MSTETKKTMSGVVASSSLVSSKGKYNTYNIVFQDGRTEAKCIFYSDGDQPKNGQTYHFMEGKWDSWLLDTKATSGGGSSSNGSSNATAEASGAPANKSSYQQSRDTFTDYQIQTRDPKIEYQTYLRMTLDTYIACIPHMPEVPTSIQDVNALIDDACIKAQALYDARNKK